MNIKEHEFMLGPHVQQQNSSLKHKEIVKEIEELTLSTRGNLKIE